jgi:hypothetical protein
MSYPPSDSVIGPITAQIANIIQTQIAGTVRVYTTPPDGPPEDGSAVVAPPNFKVVEDTNGKLCLKLSFPIRHVIRRKKFGDSLALAQQYIIPYLMAFSAWRNQSLYNGTTNLAREVNPNSGGIIQFVESGQVYVAVLINVDVLVDLNIDTSP